MKTIVGQFLETADNYPENNAVSDETGCITYAKLNFLSDIVADRILKIALNPDIQNNSTLLNGKITYHNVGVLFPRKKEALVAFLGVLKSGCSYVYSAPDAPSDRVDFIMADAEVLCIVTTKEASKKFPVCQKYELIFIEDILQETVFAGDEHINFSDYEMPAFLTYTSGSTGKPKGVVDTYAYIENHIRARHSFYKPGPDECIGNIVSFSYAASTYDLFSGLTVGCNLYIFSDEELLNQSLTVKRVIDNNITTMFMIPNMISVVFAPGVKLPIKYVITAGEKAKQIPNISAGIAEIYGSSEAAAVIGRIAKENDPWNLLGKALPGNTLFLLDDNGNRITNTNTVGELCIVNDALALEYKNRKEETEKKFTVCPFLQNKRMYHSGDLMQFDENGTYYYCGRKDNMTKINGQRVELGEVESTIVTIPGVKDAVCTIVNKNNTSMLICYYLRDMNHEPLSLEELRQAVGLKLPRYMVPLYFVELETFPRNVNGKVDRKSLPEPDFVFFTENVQPEDDEEERLLAAAKSLLPDLPFGVTDDLMKLGMDSITAVKFVSEAEKIDPRITVSDVMRLKNIRDIAKGEKKISWFHNDYDPLKKVLVLINGIVPVSGLGLIYEKWGKYFNLLVIEPFIDHIATACKEQTYAALTDFYLKEVENHLENGMEIFGFAGFSFGGQLAISLASLWLEKTGETKHVFMGDSLIQLMYPGKVLPVLTEDDPYIKMVVKNSRSDTNSAVKEPIDQIIKKQNAVIDLLRTIKTNTKYDGPVLYMDARMDYDYLTQSFKIGAVKSLYRNITILEYPNNFHNDLYRKMEIVDQYDRIIPKWLNGEFDK